MSVTRWRERCRDRADVLDIVKSPTHLNRELFARIDGHRRRRVGVDREEVFGAVRPMVSLPACPRRRGGIAAGARDRATSDLDAPQGTEAAHVAAAKREKWVWQCGQGLSYCCFEGG